MNTEPLLLSSDFRRLYCDATVFDSFSQFHPINFRGILPFQAGEQIPDDPGLLLAEEAHLADQSDATRRAVVDEHFRCGLLAESEASDLRGVMDYFEKDFFELMGQTYSNAGMFRCALRWYREAIRVMESPDKGGRCDDLSVYASVGYCLYSLGLFVEAIAWSKSCLGPLPLADAICQALIAYEVGPDGGTIRAIERAANRIRYTITTPEAKNVPERVPRLKDAMKSYALYNEIYIDWTCAEAAGAEPLPEGCPFKLELNAGNQPRHKLNLICATCAYADALVEQGYGNEARRLLHEAVLLEPAADIVRERLRALH
jgi:hypothetical protein